LVATNQSAATIIPVTASCAVRGSDRQSPRRLRRGAAAERKAFSGGTIAGSWRKVGEKWMNGRVIASRADAAARHDRATAATDGRDRG